MLHGKIYSSVTQQNGPNPPSTGMAQVAKALGKTATQLNRNCVVGVVCNTFHSPLIFNHFIEEINNYNREICEMNNIKYSPELDTQIEMIIPGYIHVNNMIKITLSYINNYLGLSQVGLMSTTGTRKTKLYKDIANELNMEIVEVDEDVQDELHDSIYNPEDGLKTLSYACHRVRGNFEKYVSTLKDKGVEVAILGCTEIPIALPEDVLFGMKLVDPMNIMAETMIQQVSI